MALVRESEISARTGEILGSGKVVTTMCFADRNLPSGFSLEVSDSPFLYLLSQNRAKETFSLQVNTRWVGQSHQGNVRGQDLECMQQAKVLEETELEVVEFTFGACLKLLVGALALKVSALEVSAPSSTAAGSSS